MKSDRFESVKLKAFKIPFLKKSFFFKDFLLKNNRLFCQGEKQANKKSRK